MSGNPEVKLAMLAVNGGRFDEAEERFTALIENGAGGPAWLGLALAKLGKVSDGEVEIAEAEACFKVARDECETEEQRDVVEDGAARHGIGLIAKLCKQRVVPMEAAGQARDTALLAAAIGGLSIVTGSSSRSLFGSLASYDVFSRSVSAVQSNYADDGDTQQAIRIIDRRIDEIDRFLRRFLRVDSARRTEVVAGLDDLHARLHPELGLRPASPGQPVARGRVEIIRGPQPSDWPEVVDNTADAVLTSRLGPWHVHHCGQSYVARDFMMLSEWAAERRINATSLVWHHALSEWTSAQEIEFLRDSLGLPPRRGIFVMRCPLCREPFTFELLGLLFLFNLAGMTCNSCKRPFNLDRRSITGADRLVRQQTTRSDTPVAEVQP